MSIKFYIKKIVAFIVLTIIIEVFVFYFSKLPRLAHYINSCNFFKTNIGSSILWGYLQIVPLIIPVIISLLFIGVYLKNDCITYLKMYNKQWIKAIIIGVSHASIVMIIAFAFEIIGSFYTAFCGAQRTPMRFRADAMRNITDAPKLCFN